MICPKLWTLNLTMSSSQVTFKFKSKTSFYVVFLASMTFWSLDVKEAGKRGAGSLRRRLEPSHLSLLFWGQRTPVMLMNTAKSALRLSASLGPVSTTPDRVWWLPTMSCATPTSKHASCRLWSAAWCSSTVPIQHSPAATAAWSIWSFLTVLKTCCGGLARWLWVDKW